MFEKYDSAQCYARKYQFKTWTQIHNISLITYLHLKMVFKGIVKNARMPNEYMVPRDTEDSIRALQM